MKLEEVLLIGVGAYLLFGTQKKAAAAPAAQMAGTAGTTPGSIIDSITSISNSASSIGNAIGGVISNLPTFGGSDDSTIGSDSGTASFDPGDPGSNRQISPLGFRPGASPVRVMATSTGVPGSSGPAARRVNVTTKPGIVPYSPFGRSISRIQRMM